MNRLLEGIYTIFCFITAMIGYHIHNDGLWAIIDFIFAPLTWCKWFIYQEVSITIIKDTFSFFLK